MTSSQQTSPWTPSSHKETTCPHPARFPKGAGGPAAFAFAQARLQAWHAKRLDEPAWRQLQAVQSFSLFLKQVRQSTLHPFLENIGDQATVHEVETLLFTNYLCHVRHVAGFAPSSWRPAILWLGELATLPRRQTPTPQDSPTTSGQDLLGKWIAHWRTTWPETGRPVQPLEALITLFWQHQRHVAQLPGSREAWEARQALEQTLTFRFRRTAGQPGAIFHHLALVALDVERLRGALTRRALFPKEPRA